MGEPLPDARRRLAGALGFASRKLWRRSDLSEEDNVVVDLVAEALVRLGRLLRPSELRSVEANISHAPSTVREELKLLAAIATPARGIS